MVKLKLTSINNDQPLNCGAGNPSYFSNWGCGRLPTEMDKIATIITDENNTKIFPRFEVGQPFGFYSLPNFVHTDKFIEFTVEKSEQQIFVTQGQ